MWGLEEIIAMNEAEAEAARQESRRLESETLAGRIAQSDGTYQEDRAEADQFNRDGVDD